MPYNKNRTCVDCGKDFVARQPNQIRCDADRGKRRKKYLTEVRTTEHQAQVCTQCGDEFTPYRGGQVTCGKAKCQRQRMNSLRLETGSKLLDAEKAREEREESGREMRFEHLAAQLGRYRAVRYQPPKGLKEDPANSSWILHLSDWHIGQRTSSGSTGGLMFHDYEVAQAQLEHMVTVQRELLRDSARKVKKALLIVNGDIVDGDDMRPSQHREIEMLVSEQAVKAYERLIWVIDAELTLVEEVVVSNVGGNHDRTSQKAGNAGLGVLGFKDTFSWLIAEMLKHHYADEPRVTIHNSSSFFSYFTFEGHRIVHNHGSDIKWGAGAYGGVPWYPIINGSNGYARMLGGFDLHFMAHGHTPAILPIGDQGILFMNGSLPGTSAYVQSSFKIVRKPVQQLVVVNKHGFVAYHPLMLNVGQLADKDSVWS